MSKRKDKDFTFKLTAARIAFKKGFKAPLKITKDDIDKALGLYCEMCKNV